MARGKDRYIGVFDSGLGGLHILRGIVKLLPQYNYIYLGDTARMPYGTRSKEAVYAFTTQAIDFLFKHGCGLIILACHTASSGALRRIQQEYIPARYPHKKILGVLIPTAEVAVVKTKKQKIGVIGTEGTVSSGTFTRELKKLTPTIAVFEKACPLLVPIIEAGEHNQQATKDVLEKYLSPLLEQDIDTLILGCTHYGILENHIRDIVGPSVCIIESSSSVPLKLQEYLRNHSEIETKLGKKGVSLFYSTGATARFQALGSQFFGKNIKVQKALLN